MLVAGCAFQLAAAVRFCNMITNLCLLSQAEIGCKSMGVPAR
jgi:hypothetical protein